MMDNKKQQETELQTKLNSFLKKNKSQECFGEECEIKNPEEIVKREHKKIITSDGRQLLNEYTK